jgi:hypothetical protein
MSIETPEPPRSLSWESPELEIPPFLRFPTNGTREATEMMIQRIDVKIAKLAKLGLRPHAVMFGYRLELAEQLSIGGPYILRVSRRKF